MGVLKRIVLIAMVSLALIGCDQTTKNLAAEHLPRGEVLSYFHDTFRIVYAENSGAFLSLGSELAPDVRFWVFVVGVGVFLAGLLVYMVSASHLTALPTIAGSLLLAGGASNCYDRLMNDGAVIDFLNIGVGSIRTGVFNVADIAIMVGGVLLLFYQPRSEPGVRLIRFKGEK